MESEEWNRLREKNEIWGGGGERRSRELVVCGVGVEAGNWNGKMRERDFYILKYESVLKKYNLNM